MNRLGYRDSGANLFSRCAPLFQEFDRSTTIQFYLKAARLAELEDKTHQAADLYEKAAMQVVRTGDFVRTFELLDTVIVFLTKLQRYERINRVVLYRVLLKLFNDDSIAARNVFDQACQAHPSFDQWEERDHIQFLIDAFDQNDKDLIGQRCQVKSILKRKTNFIFILL
jgi:outer membrane PBP1 activator LpoA protein